MNDEELDMLIANAEYEPQQLKDYITNLKQENERLMQDYINLKTYIVLLKVDTEVQDKATLYNIELENINKKRYEDYKSRVEKAVEYNQQVIKDIKDFYKPTEDIIYSGDALISIAEHNINILNRSDE